MPTINNLKLWLMANTILKDEPLIYSYADIKNREDTLKLLRGERMDSFDRAEKELVEPKEPEYEDCFWCEEEDATDELEGDWYCAKCKKDKLEG